MTRRGIFVLRWFTVLVTLAVVVASLRFWRRANRIPQQTAESPIPAATNHPIEVTRTNSGGPPRNQTETDPSPLASVWRELRTGGGTAASNRARLEQLAAQIARQGRTGGAALVRDFLATHKDAPTQLAFALGHDGMLDTAPTLRVFLLDLLERLDPQAAALEARTILATPTTSDEWAIALRSLARNQPEDRNFLVVKLRELLQYEPWRAQPSSGWLEAFDVAVHLGGNNFVGDLSGLMQSTQGPTINHAAFMALDRLATREPSVVLPALLESPSVLAGREASRAGLFARADVQDPNQRAVLERYLLDPSRSLTELRSFAGVYPNANAFVSANLLTPTSTASGGEIIRHDKYALEVVEGWLRDPRFERVRPALEQMRSRLWQFVHPNP